VKRSGLRWALEEEGYRWAALGVRALLLIPTATVVLVATGATVGLAAAMTGAALLDRGRSRRWERAAAEAEAENNEQRGGSWR
jgi:hypothetical protein